MPQADIAVYQAEWCPYSRQVRQKLTELGLPWVAMPVAAYRGERTAMEEAVGTQEIPVVVLGDGTVLDGDTDEILRELDERFDTPPGARDHHDQAEAHGTLIAGR
jgi:glutathione S-transferase